MSFDVRLEENMAAKEKIQQQLNGKIHWNAPDWETREWLKSKHAIEGDEADTMIAIAKRIRASSIRKISAFRGAIALLVSIPLLIIAWLGFQAGDRLSGEAMFIGSAGFGCLAYAGKNLIQLIRGTSEVAIDA